MEVFPGVHWLEAGYANVYLCPAENGLALVDTGRPGKAQQILDFIRHIGRDPAALNFILITHADWDHAGSAAAVQEATGATVYCSEATAAFLKEGKSPKHLMQPLQFLADRFFNYRPVPATAIRDLQAEASLPVLGELFIKPTPGHTPDHHSFYSPSSGVLFAGDALRTRGSKPRLPGNFLNHDTAAARASARQLLALAPALFACGHGPPIAEHTMEDVMKLLHSLK